MVLRSCSVESDERAAVFLAQGAHQGGKPLSGLPDSTGVRDQDGKPHRMDTNQALTPWTRPLNYTSLTC